MISNKQIFIVGETVLDVIFKNNQRLAAGQAVRRGVYGETAA